MSMRILLFLYKILDKSLVLNLVGQVLSVQVSKKQHIELHSAQMLLEKNNSLSLSINFFVHYVTQTNIATLYIQLFSNKKA